MENNKEPNKTQTADSEHYNPEKPQSQTTPKYNSTTERRNDNELPGIENLNHQDGLKDELREAKNKDSDISQTKNDESLFGRDTKTDLGGGQRDKDEDDQEQIISP